MIRYNKCSFNFCKILFLWIIAVAQRMSTYIWQRAKAVSTDMTIVAPSSLVPTPPGPYVLRLVLEKSLHRLFQPGSHGWLLLVNEALARELNYLVSRISENIKTWNKSHKMKCNLELWGLNYDKIRCSLINAPSNALLVCSVHHKLSRSQCGFRFSLYVQYIYCT